VRLTLTRLIDWFNEEKVLTYAFCLGAVAFVLVPFFNNGVMLASIAFMFGLGMGCGQPIITMLMFSHSAEGRSGEALGLRMTVNHFTRVVGPVVFGSIGSAFGLAPVFWVNALMLGSGGVLSHFGTAGRSGANKKD
jgi:MFS family permease